MHSMTYYLASATIGARKVFPEVGKTAWTGKNDLIFSVLTAQTKIFEYIFDVID